MKKTKGIVLGSVFLSVFTYAVTPLIVMAAGKDANYIVGIISRAFQTAIYLIIGFAVVTFVYNIFNYFFKPDADKKGAGMYVLMSVIGFFVILSFWGLVNIVKNTFNLDTGAPAGLFGASSNTTSGGSSAANDPFVPAGSVPGSSSSGNSSTGSIPGADAGHVDDNDPHDPQTSTGFIPGGY